MKTLQHTLKLAIIAMVLVFASCSKNDDFQAPEPQEEVEVSTLDLLISGPWNVESIQYTGSMPTTECEKQSTFNFIDEDTLLYDRYYLDAADECIEVGLKSLNYTITASDQLLISSSDSFETYQIEFISETQLIFTFEFSGHIFTYNLIKI